MRFLCLHGIGTSNQKCKPVISTALISVSASIDLPAAALRYDLADNHTYRFVQGIVPWPLASELESLSDPTAEYYAYYETGSGAASSLATALDRLEAYIEIEGPFDGVLGFSQGAGLAAMLLVRRYYENYPAKCPFRFAVFFSPISVYDPVAYERSGEIKILSGTLDDNHVIKIPIAIIYGNQDSRKSECEAFRSLCDPARLSVLVLQGGHEIPGIGLRSELTQAVKMIRRAIYMAEMLCDNKDSR